MEPYNLLISKTAKLRNAGLGAISFMMIPKKLSNLSRKYLSISNLNFMEWRQDTQHDGIRQNNIQYSNENLTMKINDIQQNDTQHNNSLLLL
jgi:hypothetical protein